MNVLAVGCHPDDLELACGGTLAKAAKQKHKVFMCHVANGNKGHYELQPEELSNIRRLEAENAGKLIGAEVISLDVPDLEVQANDDIVKQLVDVIRYTKPDFIITHNPEDYMRDHIEVSKAVFEASFSATVPHYKTKFEYYPNLCPIYYMDTNACVNFIPTEYVDISEEIDIKLNMLACHASQLKWLKKHDSIDIIETDRAIARTRGNQCGVLYAEGFKPCLAFGKMRTYRLLP